MSGMILLNYILKGINKLPFFSTSNFYIDTFKNDSVAYSDLYRQDGTKKEGLLRINYLKT